MQFDDLLVVVSNIAVSTQLLPLYSNICAEPYIVAELDVCGAPIIIVFDCHISHASPNRRVVPSDDAKLAVFTHTDPSQSNMCAVPLDKFPGAPTTALSPQIATEYPNSLLIPVILLEYK